MPAILIPLPDRDFDVTEVAVPWRLLTDAGHKVVFATERGAPPAADPLLLSGLGPLGAAKEPKLFYKQLVASPEFASPLPWDQLQVTAYDGLLLPGGHAQGMRQYLGSTLLQEHLATFFSLDRPVGAICHGVLLLARAKDRSTGQSVLHGRRTTCLPAYMERSAYYLTFWKLGRYYRTYPAYVEEEVRAALKDPTSQFCRGPLSLIRRDSQANEAPAFVLQDGNYLSARWPGDAYTFSKRFLALLDAGRSRP